MFLSLHSRYTGLMFTCLLVVGTITCAGCGKADQGYDSPEGLIPITGTATLDGEPLAGATISFLPESGTAGMGGFAITDATGNFKAQHYSQAEGLEPGTYKVIFSKLLGSDGNPIPEGKDAADVGAVESLPPSLSQVQNDNHKHMLTVNQSPQTIEYVLSSK